MNKIRDDHAAGDNVSWYNDFVDKLISGNFLLTALEFHAELIESGKELPKLKEFFSNPGNFEHLANNKPEITCSIGLPRSSSQATLDSLDLTRYSEDGERSNDDRVAVLEFELRKARETIVALRANLTVALETENKQKSHEKTRDIEDANKIRKSTIKPHEQRALNFLINEYLLLNGYKLTSITFADENERQDFDDWDDVGLNVGRPVELLSLYREGLRASGYSESILSCDCECQVTLNDDVEEDLKARIDELEAQVDQLNGKIHSLNLEFEKKLQNIVNQESIDLESHLSLSPDPEYFEIIENIKSRDESETKSDKSNGDWTKIGSRMTKESMELRSDNQSNHELSSINKKNESSSFANPSGINKDLCENKRNEDCDDKIEISDLSALHLLDNFQEALIEDLQSSIIVEDQEKKNSDEKYRLRKECTGSIFNLHESKDLSDKFMNEFLLRCDTNVPIYNANQVLTELLYQNEPNFITVKQIIDILSDSIPRIVPNIILNKREEITPLLILSICLNTSASVRDKLVNLLFNLKKKPEEDERRMILSALTAIARIMGPSMVENEMLPQCWEQITHKYIERRILVAESCFVLTPYVSETIRNSLVISIAKQLLQDREESVRKSAVNILALLVVLTSDEDKYSQILDTSLQMLNDESYEVMNSMKNVLYPVLAHWSFTLKRIQSDLFQKLLNILRYNKSLCVVHIMESLLPFLIMAIADVSCELVNSSQNVPPANKRPEFSKLCKGLCDPALFYMGTVGKVMATFDFCTSTPHFETSCWPEIEWIWKVLVPVLLETGDAALEDNVFLKEMTLFFKYLCLGLGKNITNLKLKPFLLKKLQECEKLVLGGEKCLYSVIPFYLVGVLSTNPENQQEMSTTLRKFISVLPLCGICLTPLEVTVGILSSNHIWQMLVLDGIWEGVAHQMPLVRSATAKLFHSVIDNIPESLLSVKVLPALITLSNDPEISVRVSSLPPLGMLIQCKDKTIRDKVYMTLQSVFQENNSFNSNALVIQYLKTISEIYEDCDQHFREEVIVPQLFSIAAHTCQNKSTDLVGRLTDVYATVSFSQRHLSYNCISTAFLPGLRCLESACSQLNLPYSDQIDSMIKEVERRVAASKENVCKTMASPSGPDTRRLISNAVITQVVVEDVKNRVTKIFHAKPNTIQNVSGIFKKKS